MPRGDCRSYNGRRPMSDAPRVQSPQAKRLGPIGRLVTTVAGSLCVALATLGVFLPGLPTTIFLILAIGLFARGCPHLSDKVLSWRIFRPFRPYVERTRPLPPRARNVALASMWGAILISSAVLWASETVPAIVPVLVLLAGIPGTIGILRASRSHARPRIDSGFSRP